MPYMVSILKTKVTYYRPRGRRTVLHSSGGKNAPSEMKDVPGGNLRFIQT